MAKLSIGSKNFQVMILDRLAGIFESSFGVAGFSRSLNLGNRIEFSLQCRLCGCLLHESLLFSHQATCRSQNPESEPRTTSDVESRAGSKAPIRQISAPLSYTIASAIVNLFGTDRRHPLGAIDPETRQWRASAQQQLTTIQNFLVPVKPHINFARVITSLIQWISTRPISFHAVECDLFGNFCESLNARCNVPSHRNLMRRILDFANSKILFSARSDLTFCLLMLDGATKWNHQLLDVILLSEGQVDFLDLLDLPDQKSQTIASNVAPVIQKLAPNSLIVTAVCSNNASHEKAILNPEHDYSVQ
jgi:hypothetical protein